MSTLLHKEFDESKHPRDEHGRWSFSDVRPPSEDVQDVADASFAHNKVLGNKTLPIAHLHGGVRMSDPTEVERVNSLIERMRGEGGYFSRPIVDDEGNVLEGQHRLEAARQLGASKIPVVQVKDLTRDLPVSDMEEAIRGVGRIHPDQVHQVVGNVADMIDESGSADKALAEYDVSGPYEAQYRAALRAASKGKSFAKSTSLYKSVLQARLAELTVVQDVLASAEFWKAFDESQHPRDEHGRWTSGGILYHQTTVTAKEAILREGFDLSHPGALGSDDTMPNGVFMMTQPTDLGVGSRETQERTIMPVQADIQNPLRVHDRAELEQYLSQDPEWKHLSDESRRIDVEAAVEAERESQHIRGKSKEEVAAIEAKTDRRLNEASVKIKELSSRARVRGTAFLRSQGYDGLYMRDDRGGVFGQKHITTVVAFDPRKVKPATGGIEKFWSEHARELSAEARRAKAKLKGAKGRGKEALDWARSAGPKATIAAMVHSDIAHKGLSASISGLMSMAGFSDPMADEYVSTMVQNLGTVLQVEQGEAHDLLIKTVKRLRSLRAKTFGKAAKPKKDQVLAHLDFVLAALQRYKPVKKGYPYSPSEATYDEKNKADVDEEVESRGNKDDGGSYYHRHGTGYLRAKQDGMENFGNDMMPGSRLKVKGRNRIAK